MERCHCFVSVFASNHSARTHTVTSKTRDKAEHKRKPPPTPPYPQTHVHLMGRAEGEALPAECAIALSEAPSAGLRRDSLGIKGLSGYRRWHPLASHIGRYRSGFRVRNVAVRGRCSGRCMEATIQQLIGPQSRAVVHALPFSLLLSLSLPFPLALDLFTPSHSSWKRTGSAYLAWGGSGRRWIPSAPFCST